MGVPQDANRLTSAPLQALRAVFTGIGRMVMAADRPPDPAARGGQAGATNGSAAAASGQARPGSAGGPPARRPRRGAPPPDSSRWRSLDYTGNVRLLSDEDLDDGADGIAPPPAVRPALPVETASVQPAGIQAPADPAVTTPAGPRDNRHGDSDGAPADRGPGSGGDTLPLAGYDSLTLPSIRARLRSLDAGQLRVLAAYERTHAERADVLGMLERRVEKMEAGL
jgi:hypothetical protein